MAKFEPIPIIEGCRHDCLCFFPVRYTVGDEELDDCSVPGISLEDWDVVHLSYFLDKFFDPSHPGHHPYNGLRRFGFSGEFDFYSDNLYDYPVMEQFIADMRQKSALLRKNLADPELEPLAEGFISANQLKKAYPEEQAWRFKIGAPRLADFLQRMADRLEAMMAAAPEGNAICISGP